MSSTVTATSELPVASGSVRYVTVKEYAEIMRVSPRSVYEYLRLGRIPGVVQMGKGTSYRIPVAGSL